MNNKMISTVLFLFGFIETYLIMSFYIPSLKILLIAPPLEYFFKSISSSCLFKIIISSLIGLSLNGIYILIKKRKVKIYPKTLLLVIVICLLLIVIGAIYSSLRAKYF